MPLIPTGLEAQMRRNWQVVAAIALCALFFAFHVVLFGSAATGYERAMKKAAEIGLAADPAKPLVVTPPRTLVLLAANMLPPTVTDVNREAGNLSAAMLEELTQLTQRHQMQMIITEPGLTSQDQRSVQIRAHLRVNGSYPAFVRFLDDLSREPGLTTIDRFAMNTNREGRQVLDLWVTRYWLKPGASQ